MLLSPKYVALILAFLAFNNVLIITPMTPQFAYYGFMAFVVILAIVNSKHKMDFLSLIFVFICFLSIRFNTIPSFFKSDERFVIFVIALFGLSPLFYGTYINMFKSHCFKYTNHLIVWLTLLSFIGRVSGVYSGIDRGSNFGGLTVNSMTLSPLAGISLLLCVFHLKDKVLNKKQSRFYKAMIVISFLTLILSASRIAIASTLIALMFLLLQIYKKRLGRLIKVLFGVSLFLMLSVPLWKSYTVNLIEKTEERTGEGEEFGSREDLWAFRLEEFNESPVIGIGFSNSLYGTINYDTGTVEPGTSWGVILAMTGLLGLTVFILLLFRTFNRNRKIAKLKLQLSSSHLLNTLLVFFMIHWIAEGYMLAAGSYLFFYAWLVFGVSKASESQLKIDVL